MMDPILPLTPLDVKQHTFLQASMNRGPLRQDPLLHMYQSLWETSSLGRGCLAPDGVDSFLEAINTKLEFLHMEVRRATDQNDGKEYFGIINKRSSPHSKLGTKYSVAQLGYFKAVMEAIALESSGAGYIDSFKALTLKPVRCDFQQVDPSQPSTSQVQAPLKMTFKAKGEALVLLVEDQWLHRNAEGEVSLGTRAYLELRGVFRDLEVPFCEVCNEAAITADLCENPDCPVRMHSYCAVKKFRGRQARVCSGCKTRWSCGASGSTSNSLKREMEEGIEDVCVARRTRSRTCYTGNPSQKGSGSSREESEIDGDIQLLDFVGEIISLDRTIDCRFQGLHAENLELSDWI